MEMQEALSELYLMLWQQLEAHCSEDKWLRIQPVPDDSLLPAVRKRVAALAPDASSILLADFNKTQALLLLKEPAYSGDLAAFREYLRDQGLRYAELADQMWLTPQ